MELRIFAVFDVKAGCYSQPWFTTSKGLAIRSFSELANDKTHQFGKYPEDFTLFEIGVFDDTTAHIQLHESKQSLGTAIEFVRLQEARSQLKMPLNPGVS